MNDLKFAFRQLLKNPGFTVVFMSLASNAATVGNERDLTDGSNSRTSTEKIALPPEVRQQLETQKAGLRAIYLEFTTTNRGTLPNWNYDVAPAYSAAFEGNHFYRQEQIPRDEGYDNEVAFDGQTIWRLQRLRVTKYPLADAPELLPSKFVQWPYLEAAGIYAPGFGIEVGRFSALEPLVLHYLDQSDPIKVERVGVNLRVTFQVEDELARLQAVQMRRPSKDSSRSRNPDRRNSVKPTRKVVFLLDPKHGYGAAEREEWNTAGQRTCHIQSEDWKNYESAGIWLPSRCIAFYYARPRLFLDDFSKEPVHIVTNELTRVEFGPKNIPFTFVQTDQPKPGSHIFDRTTPDGSLANAPQVAAQEKVDLATIERIKTEVMQNSQVMDIVGWLTDVYGPRLTGSPNTKAASDWALATMRSWGLSNIHLEPWGPFDRGWMNEQFTFRAVAPRPFIINAVPSVWSPGTKGRVTGSAIRLDVHSFADLQRLAGKLKKAFLLMETARPTPAHFKPEAQRLTDARLDAMAAAQPSSRQVQEVTEMRYNYVIMEDPAARRWLVNEGVCALLFTAPGDGGTIQLAGRGTEGARKKNTPAELPLLKVSAESYGRIVRILEKNIPVTLELEMQNTFYNDPDVFNIIAEIPGTDQKLKDEVVMIGAHFDSWTFGTGATDNAAGSAMVMEAMRILKELNLQPRRTIRIALWTGEEQGALGSNAYIQQHLRDSVLPSQANRSATKSERDSFSVYFNLDGGTGKIRGILNVRNAGVRTIFDAWMRPFKEMGMKTVSSWDIGGGDQTAFESVGLPTFGFIQDPIEYETRTHHTSADVYERIQPEDLQFNTAVLASFAWQAAQRDEKMPR